jgi:hypothetical protein
VDEVREKAPQLRVALYHGPAGLLRRHCHHLLGPGQRVWRVSPGFPLPRPLAPVRPPLPISLQHFPRCSFASTLSCLPFEVLEQPNGLNRRGEAYLSQHFLAGNGFRSFIHSFVCQGGLSFNDLQ